MDCHSEHQLYTADGSPIAVYVRSSGSREAALIDAQLLPRCHVLELGCGAGRLTHELIALGHRVTAVDNSPEVLAHVRGADIVLADIVGLDLQRRFDAVVLWSYLINNTDATIRHELMAACRRHVDSDGVVLLLRHEPGWVRTVEAFRSDPIDGIVQELHSVEHHGDRLRATIAWELDGEHTNSASKPSTSTTT